MRVGGKDLNAALQDYMTAWAWVKEPWKHSSEEIPFFFFWF